MIVLIAIASLITMPQVKAASPWYEEATKTSVAVTARAVASINPPNANGGYDFAEVWDNVGGKNYQYLFLYWRFYRGSTVVEEGAKICLDGSLEGRSSQYCKQMVTFSGFTPLLTSIAQGAACESYDPISGNCTIKLESITEEAKATAYAPIEY